MQLYYKISLYHKMKNKKQKREDQDYELGKASQLAQFNIDTKASPLSIMRLMFVSTYVEVLPRSV